MGCTTEEKAIIWLCSLDLDYRTRVAVLRAAGDPARLLSEPKKFFGPVIKEGAKRVYKNGSLSAEQAADALAAELDEKGYFAVTIASDDYPESLKAIADPPLLLYGAGNRGLLKKRRFCIVGSRRLPPWAESAGRRVAEELAQRFAIVTGLAEGGDSAAAAGALASGNAICVLPNGLDVCYPASHAGLKRRVRETGLLLSEYPPAEGVKKYSFHARNRILAGLSEGVLVIAAGEKSGALITADYALEYGREVFAFPYNPGVSQGIGCNELIKKGACLTTGAADVLAAFGMDDINREKAPLLSQEERAILEVLRENGEMHTAQIAAQLGCTVFEAAAHLSSLELRGLAVKAGGNRYTAV